MDETKSAPQLIAINHDDHYAKHVGRTQDGRQFFLTNPFEPARGAEAGCEYISLFLFDGEGRLMEATIDELGPRSGVDELKARRLYQERLASLGEVVFDRIEVRPFAIERFGRTFGLILREPDDEDDTRVVEMMPGNYMAFFEPWDSGDYDT